MGKNRQQAGLVNVINYDENNNLSLSSSPSSSIQTSGSVIATSITGSFTGSVFGLGDTVSFSSSVSSDLSNLESKSASVDISINNINSFTASNGNQSLNQLTGSLATTGSNTFYGTQVFSGSVYIANDLVVQGSSSIQYITGSSVNIGTNIVQLNTANPSVRYAGLTMIDSGSVGGSGSFLYDSLQDEFIFVHRGNGTNITSSHFVLGPETYDSLGNETYLTTNILSKGTGKEHLMDSCIFDNGTTTCIKNNLVGTGTISGTTIYGSTAVCSPVGKFTSCIDAGSGTFSNSLTVDYAAVDVDLNVKNTQSAGAANLYLRANANGTADLRFTRNSDSSIQGRISYSFTDGSMNFRTGGNDNKLLISSAGAATFACSVGIGTTLSVTGATSLSCRLAVGASDQTYASIFIGGDITSGANQYAIIADPQLSGTSNSYALFANARIKANTAVTNAFGVYIPSAEKMSGATITNNYALYIANQTSGTTLNYSIYSSGGANYFGGCVGIGINTPGSKLHVYSSATQDGIRVDATTYPEVVLSRGGTIKAYLAIAGSAGGYGTGTLVDSLILRSENAIHLSPNAGGIALTLASAGIACFSSTVCAPTLRASGTVIGGNFVTDSGTASIPYNSYATFYTVQNYQNAIYLVTLQLNGYSNYTAFATIIQNDSNLQIANSLSNVAAIQVSGLNIQGTNGSGITQSMPYKIIRIG